MRLIFSSKAWDEYLYWQKTDKAVLKRIHFLIKEIMLDSFDGIGKPEPLKHSLSRYWSRRITDEHRLVYKVSYASLLIAQIRYHYEY
ncbi:MAG: toxin YoeB [Cellvibrionaceae bacterium]|jgi:toxin YoeB